MYQIIASNKFKKDFKKSLKRGLKEELLKEVVSLLGAEGVLPQKYKTS